MIRRLIIVLDRRQLFRISPALRSQRRNASAVYSAPGSIAFRNCAPLNQVAAVYTTLLRRGEFLIYAS